jgi:hypothetical protein
VAPQLEMNVCSATRAMLLREKWPRAWIICHNFGVAIVESLIVNSARGGRKRKAV